MFENVLQKLGLTKNKLLDNEASEVIAGIRDHFGSCPTYGLTPIKLAKLLKISAEGDTMAYFEMGEEMEEKELQYATVLSARKRTVSQLDTTVIPADDSAAADRQAEFVKLFFDRDNMSREYFDMLDAVGKGISLMEINWECSESQWLPKSLEYVPPTWLDFSKDLKTPMLKAEGGSQPLTPYKFLYTTIKAKSGLDIRSGLTRSVCWAFMFKNYSLKDWISFLEIYGHPYRVGKYGKNATETDKKKLLKAVYTIGADAAAIIPHDMMIDFIKTEAKAGGDAFQAHAEYLDHMISKAVLGQSTTTDAISGGHAVSKEHNEVRLDIANSDAKQLASVINEQLIKPIIDLNFGRQKAYPKIIIGNPETEDTTKLTENIARLAPYGLTVSMKQLRSKLGIDAPQDENDTFGFSPNQLQTLVQTENRALNKHLNSLKNGFNRDLIDDLTAEELNDWQPLVDPVLQKLKDLAERLLLEGKSLDDFKAELVKLDINPEILAQSLTKMSITARLNGEQHD